MKELPQILIALIAFAILLLALRPRAHREPKNSTPRPIGRDECTGIPESYRLFAEAMEKSNNLDSWIDQKLLCSHRISFITVVEASGTVEKVVTKCAGCDNVLDTRYEA